jgi:hypothetical protein
LKVLSKAIEVAAEKSNELPAPGSNPRLEPLAAPAMVMVLGVPAWTVIELAVAPPVY